jgi:ABC-2 type transport system permease protein
MKSATRTTRKQKEGSPFTGLWTVTIKEMADHMGSIRIRLLLALVALSTIGAIYSAVQQIRTTVGEDPFVLLHVLTVSKNPLPSFVAFLSFLIPLGAIALGFDAINSEYNRRTLSRVLAQPIYRDAFLVGKFLGAFLTLMLTLAILWLLVIGLALLVLGVPPSAEEIGRSLMFFIAALFYAGVWLAVAMLFSAVFRQPSTSALASLGVWLLFAIFWNMLAGLVGQIPSNQMASLMSQIWFSRISPNTLFAEAMIGLLDPTTRALGPILYSQLEGAVMGSPLPFGQSVLLTWPQLTALIAEVILLFTAMYVIFQRQEIRA